MLPGWNASSLALEILLLTILPQRFPNSYMTSAVQKEATGNQNDQRLLVGGRRAAGALGTSKSRGKFSQR